MYSYDTASQAISDLIKRGYDANFNPHIDKDNIVTKHPISKSIVSLSPEDIEIDEIYRFEGNSDPGDEMVVYAVSCKRYALKGILVDAFGSYSNSNESEVIKRLAADPRHKGLTKD